jgi:hypothetical protein
MTIDPVFVLYAFFTWMIAITTIVLWLSCYQIAGKHHD